MLLSKDISPSEYSTAQSTTHHNMDKTRDGITVNLNNFAQQFWNVVFIYYSIYHPSELSSITDFDANCCMNGDRAYFKDGNVEKIPNITVEHREAFLKAYAEYQNTPQPLRKFFNEMHKFPQWLRADVFRYFRFYHPSELSSIKDNDAYSCMIGPSAYFKDGNVEKIPDITVEHREAFQKAYAEYHQKHLPGVPPRCCHHWQSPQELDYMVELRMKKCLALLPYVCAVFPTEDVTFDWERAQIRVKLPTESSFTFLSIVDYDKHRVTMACVKETSPGEPYGIAELADTPIDCSTFEEMVGDMLFNITSVKLGTADLFTEWYD